MALFLQGQSRLLGSAEEVMVLSARRNKPMPKQKWLVFELNENVQERGLNSIDFVLNIHYNAIR